MKHLIIFLLLLFSMPIIAQRHTLEAKYFIFTNNRGEILDEEEVSIDMILDLDKSRLVIYSKDTQVIDYEVLRVYTNKDNYTVMECSATDTNWKRILLEISVSEENESVLVFIFYKNYSYCYICTI